MGGVALVHLHKTTTFGGKKPDSLICFCLQTVLIGCFSVKSMTEIWPHKTWSWREEYFENLLRKLWVFFDMTIT